MEFPSFTKTWHNNTYPAINPTNPAVSAAGKTVFITGGGAGVGLSIAKSFATAGASTIAISGRTEKTLVAAKKGIESAHPKTKVLTFVADVTDEAAVDKAFSSIGKIDVMVSNAGYMPEIEPMAVTTTSEWWKGFEVNIKGSFIVSRAFVKNAAEGAVLINLATGVAHLPAFPAYSAYGTSKLGAIKLFDSIQAENPQLRVVSVHPGVIKSDMSDKSTAHGEAFPFDDASLPSNTIVWASSLEAKFLKGKTIWSNWDVEELMAQSAKIESSPVLTLGLLSLYETGYTNLTSPAQSNIV